MQEYQEDLRKAVENSIELWQQLETLDEQLDSKRLERVNFKRRLAESEVRLAKKYWEYQQTDRKCRLVEGDLTSTIHQVEELEKDDGDWPDVSWELPPFIDGIEGELSYTGEVEVEMD